jgi:hypothetical protein
MRTRYHESIEVRETCQHTRTRYLKSIEGSWTCHHTRARYHVYFPSIDL